jgi:Tol biopolymer transport system component
MESRYLLHLAIFALLSLHCEIVTMQPGDYHLLLDEDRLILSPSWNRNGDAFCYGFSGGLWVMDFPGGQRECIYAATESTSIFSCDWSPIDDRIVCCESYYYPDSQEYGCYIITINSDGSNRTVLWESNFGWDVCWWPDGSKAVLSSSSLGVYLLDVEEGGEPEHMFSGSSPDVSSDGNYIVFSSGDLLMLYHVSTGYIIPLTEDGIRRFPVFSPNMEWVACSFREDDYHVEFFPLNGGDHVTYLSFEDVIFNFDWSPSGKHVLFSTDSDGDEYDELYCIYFPQ